MKTKLTFFVLFALACAGFGISEFDLRTKSGLLWPDIESFVKDSLKEPTDRATKAEARVAVLEAFLAKAKEAFNAGDFDSAKAILNPEITKAEQSEKDKRKAELDEQIAKLQVERAELDKAAEIKSKP